MDKFIEYKVSFYNKKDAKKKNHMAIKIILSLTKLSWRVVDPNRKI